jgi:phospholipid/cholesterol/gamma-HCH transport system substrate-binding protein
VGFEETKFKLDSILTGVALLVESNRRDISQLLGNLNTLSATLADEQIGVSPLLAKINVLADSLNALELKQTVSQANVTLQSLQATVEKLRQDEGTLGKLMNNDSVYNNLNKTLVDLDSLFIDLQENPRRYVHFSLFGGKDKSK